MKQLSFNFMDMYDNCYDNRVICQFCDRELFDDSYDENDRIMQYDSGEVACVYCYEKNKELK